MDQKIRLSYNDFENKHTKDNFELEDEFLKKGQLSIAQTKIAGKKTTINMVCH
jgi:hypothetical protein